VLTARAAHEIDNRNAGAIGLPRFHRSSCLENRLLIRVRSATRCEGFTVTKKEIFPGGANEATAENTTSDLEPISHPPTDAELAEFFGGDSGFLPIWRPTFGRTRE